MIATMRLVVPIAVLLLLVLHQDYWQWGNDRLVLGFLPYSMAYHVGISIAAAAIGWLATRYCWPEEDEISTAAHDAPSPASSGEVRR